MRITQQSLIHGNIEIPLGRSDEALYSGWAPVLLKTNPQVLLCKTLISSYLVRYLVHACFKPWRKELKSPLLLVGGATLPVCLLSSETWRPELLLKDSIPYYTALECLLKYTFLKSMAFFFFILFAYLKVRVTVKE